MRVAFAAAAAGVAEILLWYSEPKNEIYNLYAGYIVMKIIQYCVYVEKMGSNVLYPPHFSRI